jgi:type I restriction enzyme S subunit
VTQFSIAANGVTRYGLSQGAIKAILLPVPKFDEQKSIVHRIDKATTSLNAAIRRATCEINLIQEYRNRLIADVVTGKMDVRGFTPTEPKSAQESMDELMDAKGLEDNESELVEDTIDVAD